jgi:hypothetical protein
LKLYNSITGECIEITDQVEAERWSKSTTPWCKEITALAIQEENASVSVTNKQPDRKLDIELTNCYGIPYLKYPFTFNYGLKGSYVIYAPNGVMKTSFARTFEDLSNGDSPKEERFNREASWSVKTEAGDIEGDNIFVLKSEIDISTDGSAITNILVNPEKKARYDELLVDLDKKKTSLLKLLKKKSGLKKESEVEQNILADFDKDFLADFIVEAKKIDVEERFGAYKYATIFDPNALAVIESQEFINNASEFNQRYQQIFEQTGSIYTKGVFNPSKADKSFGTLDKQGFFKGGHKVQLKGDSTSLGKDELDKKIEEINGAIDSDPELKAIKDKLAKNVQAQNLTQLLESLPSSEVEEFLTGIQPENINSFKRTIWAAYIKNESSSESYTSIYKTHREEIISIEKNAEEAVPRWVEAIKLFNNRFIEMPFQLSIPNHSEAALGKKNARLSFIFKDGEDERECTSNDVFATLSQGEKRALYLLTFIFEVKSREINNQRTFFVIDDIADSFDYKNKHAIIQYLKDISKNDLFNQLILTHNFDFFRALANSHFVHREHCLMTIKKSDSIALVKADGINNYFVNIWKNKVDNDDVILCATIPFTRNLLEYTKGEEDADYLKLTSLLHWKEDTDQITVGEYIAIYNKVFSAHYDESNQQSLKELMLIKAGEICNKTDHNGINLEDKVLLSIAARILSEEYMTNKIRELQGNKSYWFTGRNPFGSLINELSKVEPEHASLVVLEQVNITVSSNIHINSFMYEPILDLGIENLISLYKSVYDLNES